MNEIAHAAVVPASTNAGPVATAVDLLRGKRIAVISYPTLFQTAGGMAMKVRKTVEMLAAIGVDATLPNLVDDSIADFDLVHVFGAFNSNDRIVTLAKGFSKPVVLSPILMPPFPPSMGLRAKLLDRAVGRFTGWTVGTTYGQIRDGLDAADKLIALGTAEKDVLTGSFGQPESKIVIVPNGVGEQFFAATPDLFRKKFATARPVVLHVGIVGDVKNQLGLVRALRDEDVEIVLAGPCSDHARPYLEQCLREGGAKVRYLGEFPHGDELLTSAYAAASVLAVPSTFEGMSNCVLEALAAGTPVVTTKYHSWDYQADASTVVEVEPTDPKAIRDAVCGLLSSPKASARCRAVVAPLSWTSVAHRVADVYGRLVT
jgi:glycosyltransferase involved in cell wall biosynthesis